MKPPLCLASFIFGTQVALATPSKTSAVRGSHGFHADDGPSRRRPGHELDPNGSIFIRTVPVPPASAAAAESRLQGRRALQEKLGHRPHPSYLDQTTHFSTKQASNGQQRHRSLYQQANGTMHNLVLLLRFSDHAGRDLPSRADISRLYNSDATDPFAGDVDDIIVPTGSVRQVYESNSHSIFTIETTVVDWITLSKSESYYGNGNNGFTKFKEAIVEALTMLDNGGGGAMGGPPFNFAEFDLDENGALDGLGILHSGYGAEYGGDDCHGAPDKDRIWSHKGGMDWTSSPEAGGHVVDVNRFYVSSALRGKCHSNIVRMGVIVHEIGHYLSLPDLYDETFEGKGLGAYDFMSQSWGFDGSGMYPPNLSAWSKVFLGWAKVEVIAYDGTYQIESSATSNKVYKIEAGYPEGEYLLIENRQPTGYDMKMEGGGLAVYHIDDKADSQNNRGYPSTQSDWPKNGKHYQVALLAADGEYDLEKGTNEGDSGDLWHFGSELKELRSGSSSHPNTDSYQYGSVTLTGVRIYGFGFSGESMTFRVDGLGMNAAGSGSADGIAVSLESMMTPKPTPKPSTPKPVTAAPTSPPPTSKPVTKAPTGMSAVPTLRPPTPKPVTEAPAKTPSKMPVASRPTMKPTPPSSQSQPISNCANRCLEELSSSLCPPNPWEHPGCLQVNVGELCEANGECGSNQLLNNCQPFDIYRRIECTPTNTSGTATSAVQNYCPYYPGWYSGLPFCVNDCQQPEFMRSNPAFEFYSPIECCLTHFEGKSSCLTASQVDMDFNSETELVISAPAIIEGEEEESTPVLTHSNVHTKSSTSDSFTRISSLESSTTEIDITPTDDTTIHSQQNVEFTGGDEWLLVGPQFSSSPQLKWRDEILLKFDLNQFALGGREDYRAVLRLFALTSSPSGGVVHSASSNSWEETKVDWSSSPEGELILGKVGPTRPNSWVEVDVTLPRMDDGFATLRITPENSNHSWVAKYSSKENRMGHPAPELRVFF